MKKVPKKNYVFLGVILIFSIAFLYYFYLWFAAYEKNELSSPIMDKYLQTINYNELDSYLIENKDAIIYVSVLENESVRDFELNFKTVVKSKSLRNEILYLNLTEELKSMNNQDIAVKYNIDNISINNVPCILIFKDGVLVDSYDIVSNNYQPNNIIKFLKKAGYIE